jgi:hypothetical protein
MIKTGGLNLVIVEALGEVGLGLTSELGVPGPVQDPFPNLRPG